MAKSKAVDRAELVRSLRMAMAILDEVLPHDPAEEDDLSAEHWNRLREMAFPVILDQVVDYDVA